MDGLLLVTSTLEPLQKWALIAAAVLTILYAVMRPSRKKRKDPLATRTPMSLAGQREVEKQMTELIVELEKMARQMTAQLDTRSTKLELLIRDADERLAALQAAGGSASLTSSSRAPRLAEHGSDDLPDPRHSEVYELAESGQSPHQIAQRLGRPYGEVELILALRGHERSDRHAIAS